MQEDEECMCVCVLPVLGSCSVGSVLLLLSFWQIVS